MFLAGAKLRAEDLNGLVQPLQGKILRQGGTYLTTVGTTELDLPKLSLSGITLTANAATIFNFSARFSAGTTGDTFDVIIRQTTALSGPSAGVWRVIVPSGNQFSVSLEYPWLPASGSVINAPFYISILRAAGTGTLSVEAGTQTSFAVYAALTTSVWTGVP